MTNATIDAPFSLAKPAPRPVASAAGCGQGEAADPFVPNFHWYAFLLGLGARLEVQFIGYLPLSEIAILLLIPFFLQRLTSRPVMRATRWLLPLLALWLIGAVATDLYRHTNWSLAARGAARVIVMLAAVPMTMLFMRADTYRKLVWFYAGLVASAALSGFVFKSGARIGRDITTGASGLTWETHWNSVLLLSSLLAALLLYRRSHLLGYAACIAAGVVNLALGSRSAGGVIIAGPLIAMSMNMLRHRQRIGRLRISTLLIVGSLAVATAFGLMQAYSATAKSGQLGDRALAKYELQSRNKFGLLIGGRTEILSGIIAVSESPIIGYGSWPLDTQGFYLKACELAEVPAFKSYYKKGYPLIPCHSHIVQAWVECGILGALFWFYALFIVGKSLFVPLLDEKRLRLWVSSVATFLIWQFIFSPISSRLEESLILSVLLVQMGSWPLPGAIPGRRPLRGIDGGGAPLVAASA
jgi:hypothetical protein